MESVAERACAEERHSFATSTWQPTHFSLAETGSPLNTAALAADEGGVTPAGSKGVHATMTNDASHVTERG